MGNADLPSLKETLSKYWGNFKSWFCQLSIEQRILFLTGFVLIFSGLFIDVKSNPALVIGALFIILAAIDPASIKDFALKWGKSGPEVSFNRRTATEEETEILKEASQENPTKEIKEKIEELIEAAEKRKEGERAPEDYLALAIEAWKEKDYERGLAYAYSGLNLDPKNLETRAGFFNTLGFFYHELKSYPLAEENYKKSIQIDKNFHPAFNNLGILLKDIKRYKEAEEVIKKVLPLSPGYANAYHTLGTIYADQKKHDEALIQINKALSLDPNHVNAHNSLGNIFQFKKQYKEAELEYKETLRLDPDYAIAHNGLGNVYLKLKLPAKAEFEYKEALRINPGFVQAYSNLGVLYYQQKKLSEAESTYREGLRLDPTDPNNNGNLGFLLFDFEKYEEALNHFNKALEKDVNLDCLAGKAIALLKLGRKEEALNTYKNTTSKEPKYFDLSRLQEDHFWSDPACETAQQIIDELKK